jgi:ABC-type transporter MlaC component
MKVFLSTMITILTISFAQTKPSSSIDVVKNIFKWAKNQNISKNKNIQKNVNELIAFEYISKKVLGKHYLKKTKSERNWFKNTLKKMMAQSLYPKASGYLDKVKIKYKKTIETNKNLSVVRSVIIYRGEETEVNYKLVVKNKKWKLIDILIDDDSWVDDIQEQVQDTLELEGWKSFKNRLNKKINNTK